MNAQNALKNYQHIDHQSAVESASPHHLIHMLMEGALSRIARAKGCIQHDDIAEKGVQIGKAISIIGGLQGSLDMDVKGDIASNLDSLYDYMARRLYDANKDNDMDALDEVSSLIKEIKSAWDAIPEEHHFDSNKHKRE